MASLSKETASGLYRILLVGSDGKRRTIRTGVSNKKLAETNRTRVEELHACKLACVPHNADLATWLAGVGDELHAKLSAVGLIPGRQSAALGPFLDEYIAHRSVGGKATTVITLRQVRIDLGNHFGAATPLRAIGHAEAEGFKRHYLARKLASATTARRLKMAAMFFKVARKGKLVGENPFDDVRHRSENPEENRHYVAAEVARRLIGGCTSVDWRTLVALARFGGLRCPNEAYLLAWSAIDFPARRMVVPSPKTECHGKPSRVVPIFPAPRPFLEEARRHAPVASFVLGDDTAERYRRIAREGGAGWNGVSLHALVLKVFRRAGLEPWPRPFQNMRASCETDLMQDHPIHVVTAWMGNTPKIALAHYLQTTEGDFRKAAQNPAQSPTDGGGHGTTKRDTPGEQSPGNVATCLTETCPDVQWTNVNLAKVGLEPTHLSALDFESSASAIPPLGRPRRLAGGARFGKAEYPGADSR